MRSLVFIALVTSVAATCNFITQQPGQYCHDLAVRCKISDADFFKYNPNIKSDCSNLSAGSKVCCNAGGLAPPPNSDGSCATYKVNQGDNCGAIGGQYGLTIDQINNFNFKNSTSFGGTWGFQGCQNLQIGYICISKGNKGPIPALQKDAEGNPVPCGPTASGNGTNIQCPLKACCNSWGQCGLTDDFCKITNPKLNPGVSGCQDNCDVSYVKGSAPATFVKVGYYETWNQNWPCLNARIRDIDLSDYTHVHYSFADILPDYTIYLDPLATEQFSDFKSLSGVKKIISFGGWGISTSPPTFQHLRLMVQNPDKYVNALVAFAESNNLDGIDIDWEYPGATDIPGIIPGLPSDGPDYLNFLKTLRARLPSSKSISIAAPASYWYLKNFPIVEMSKILDYIVFMTYDLHGQWDYSIPSLGPHLLSHVNWTETQSMLNLITHAGVPSNKVLLGLAKYGRSFQQVDPNCYGPTCKFTGPLSGATPGKCTNTSGYIGLGEIKEIISKDTVRKTYVDAGSQILLYGKDQWVAYLTDDQLASRTSQAKSMNLGGTITWAMDLDSKEAVDTCDMSHVFIIDDLTNTVCSNHDMRTFFVTYILDAIDYWNAHSTDYDKAMPAFKSYYNITDPHPTKASYDTVFTTLTNYISALPSGDISEEQMALLYFYAKRCAVFYQPAKSGSKKRAIELSVFGGGAAYAQLVDEGAEAATAALSALGAATEAAGAIGVLVTQAIPVVGAVVAIGASIAALFVGLWDKKSTPVPDSVITLAQGNEQQLDKIKGLITDPDSVADYYSSISSIDYGTDVDPMDYDIIPGPYTKLTSYVLDRINSPYYWNLRKKSTSCKADDQVNINNEQYDQLMTKLTNKKKETVGIPVYWINFSGRSPGVACNAWFYFSKKMLQGDDINTINTYTRFIAGKDRKYYLDKYDCSKYGKQPQTDRNGVTRQVSIYQKDEFPFAGTYEGMIVADQEYDVSIACVDGSDNGSDGSYFGQFVDALSIYQPWNDHIVGKDSGPRQGALTDHQAFLIKIYQLPPIEQCPENTLNGNFIRGFAMTPDGTNRRPNVVNHFYESIT
jgi:GH18 family chitinase